ncbi:MAG: hypothetical protein KAS39_08770 [Actinomycetia bacterium]|nr:hypothetical protein [Actinomycetes bacterium]
MSNLLKLQEIDLKLDKLLKEKDTLGQQVEIKKLNIEIERIESKYSKKNENFKNEILIQKKIEGEMDLIEVKMKKEDKRMYSGTVTNPKELSSIGEEIVSLKKQKDNLETKLLVQMDKIGELEGEKDKIGNYLNGLKDKLKEVLARDSKKIEELEGAINQARGEKEAEKAEVNSEVLEKYEELRSEVGGKVASLLTNDGVCEGCFMALPAEEIDKMLQEKEKLWLCSHCSRILVIGK